MRQRASISVFTRMPRPGRSKTRLIPLLGPDGAAALQREMTEHVVRQMRILQRLDGGIACEVRVADGSAEDAHAWLGVPCSPQGDGDLGSRLERAFAAGAGRAALVAVLGADCPTVTVRDMDALLAEAERYGGAIIPASDGGFCALALAAGIATNATGLLHSIDWGTADVCGQTLERPRGAGLDVAVLPERADIDRPEDLPVWQSVNHAWYAPPTSLAVVIPVLNEADRLPSLLERLAAEGVEVVMADGGSTDGSVDIARSAGAMLVTGARGRAAQMNAGAAATAADALMFLHADTVPPAGFRELALDALARDGVALGAFSFAPDWRSPSMRLIEFGTRLRGRCLRLPYGDQALFCRRAIFEALGGFPPVPVMEDYEFVRRARRAGEIVVLPQGATTSARRWREAGPWRWTWLNLATVARYRLGMPPEDLAKWRAAHSKR